MESSMALVSPFNHQLTYLFAICRELFVQENYGKDKETKDSKSNQILLDDIGGNEALISALKTDPKVSDTWHTLMHAACQRPK